MATFLHHLDLLNGKEMVTSIIANCVAVFKNEKFFR